jgi:ferritin-like metal-binding protein YciE
MEKSKTSSNTPAKKTASSAKKGVATKTTASKPVASSKSGAPAKKATKKPTEISRPATTAKATTKKGTASPKTTAATKKRLSPSKSNSSSRSEFEEFFIDELKDIYWAEQHLAKALPKMQQAATSEELAEAFERHTQDTINHIETLERVFMILDEKPQAKKCDAMAGLIEEANGIIEDTESGTMIRDAALILAAQKVEHYEIATYGTLVVFAKNMGNPLVAEQLEFTLNNEKATDIALTQVAVAFINRQAAEE